MESSIEGYRTVQAPISRPIKDYAGGNDLTTFWKKRFATHGHTGWADQFIYGFDQPCRLHVFSQWLESNESVPGSVLDFGCGSGEFSHLLAQRGWCVTGYDKYVQPQLVHPRFEFTSHLPDPARAASSFDLIIAVTVLDSITDEREFQATLAYLRGVLSFNGRFLFIEYAPDSFLPPSHYQSFRTINAWQRSLDGAGLKLETLEPFFHPEKAPVMAWTAYAEGWPARLLRKLLRYALTRNASKELLKRRARLCLDRHAYISPSVSPIKMLAGRRDLRPGQADCVS
jgi:SAM-dependent methyltransferase